MFWMIWNPGNMPPKVQHYSEADVRLEAERLARKHPGQKFFVLKSIDCCQKRDVLWASDTDIPF